jgi:hypothetical protein
MNAEVFNTIPIPAGKRTYFLDIKTSREGVKYLVLTESKRNKKGEYQHDRVMIFKEHLQEFFDGMIKLAPGLGIELIGTDYVKEIRKFFPNAYIPWTKEDDEKLEQLYCEGKTLNELTAIFKRKPGAITSRIKKLELKEKYSK